MTTVFFDLDETLIEHTRTGPELLREVYEAHPEVVEGLDKAQFDRALWETANGYWQRMFDADVHGEMALVAMFREALEALARDGSAAVSMRDQFMEAVLASTRPSPGAKEALVALRARGVRTGIITNGYAYLQRAKIHHHGYEALFDTIVVSEEAGAHKPEGRIFELALERVGARPETAWHVGDNLENDIAGAERAGLTSVLYDPHGDREPDSELVTVEVYPSHVIRGFEELATLLEKAARTSSSDD